MRFFSYQSRVFNIRFEHVENLVLGSFLVVVVPYRAFSNYGLFQQVFLSKHLAKQFSEFSLKKKP